jgi:hypothetical protein
MTAGDATRFLGASSPQTIMSEESGKKSVECAKPVFPEHLDLWQNK